MKQIQKGITLARKGETFKVLNRSKARINKTTPILWLNLLFYIYLLRMTLRSIRYNLHPNCRYRLYLLRVNTFWIKCSISLHEELMLSATTSQKVNFDRRENVVVIRK